MKGLLVFKEKLMSIYAKGGIYIKHILTFILAFVSFFVTGREIGYNSLLANPLICIAMAFVCAFLPVNVTVVVATLLIIIHLFGLSLELAVIATCVMAIVYLLYFRYAPNTGYLLILTPLMFFLHIPYVIPVVAALTVGFAGIIPTLCGTFIYFLVSFASNYSTAITTLNEDNALQNINFIFNNIFTNKELIVVMASFSVVIMLIYLLKKMSANYSWIIAIISGCVLDALVQLVAFSVLDVVYNPVFLILGHIIAIGVGLLLNLLIFSVDYNATEYVQFEDNDYFYYVKAVPKVSMVGKEVTVKKINSRQDRGFVHTESYDDESDDNF